MNFKGIDKVFPGLKKDGNGKFVEPKNAWFGKHAKRNQAEKPPIKYEKVNQTINLHASKLMPKDERLNFVDPKTAELPIKVIPRLKVYAEAMSSSTRKPPKPLLTYALVAVIASIAITIVYTQVFQKQQNAEHEFLLDWQKACIAAGQTLEECNPPQRSQLPTGQAGGGGLFDFKLINPFEAPGTGIVR